MEDLSLHILDIVENSLDAGARRVKILLEEDEQKDLLSFEIADDGKGMDREMVKRALDPFVTTKTTRKVGLGLPLLAQAVKAANGKLTIQSRPDKGTRVKATFQLSHIDTKPLGDIPQTLVTLIVGHPHADFLYSHKIGRSRYAFDTRELRAGMDGVPLQTPEVVGFIKKNIKDGLDQLRRKNERRSNPGIVGNNQ